MITQQSSPESFVVVATNDFGATHRYEIKDGQGVFIGKSTNCGLQLHDAKINDIHCRIGMENGRLHIQNWMSAEGTMVNGKEIEAEQEIGLLDIILVGSHKIQIVTSKTAADKLVASKNDCSGAAHSSDLIVDSPLEDCHKESASIGDLDTDSLVHSPTEEIVSPSDNDSNEAPMAADQWSMFEMEDDGEFELQLQIDADSMDVDFDFFSMESEESCDRETIAMLQAEIDDLRAALASRDADRMIEDSFAGDEPHAESTEASDDVLHRMQELADEANRSDERAAILEEMLHAAEDANRSEREERSQLEAWVHDIEQRIGHREAEHAAEIDALKLQLKESADQQDRLHKQLRQVAAGSGANLNKQYEELLENLQGSNRDLKEKLVAALKNCASLEKRLQSAESDESESLRAERTKLAQEQAKVSRMRYELSSKLAEIEQVPRATGKSDMETGQRIRALREHLREIHEQEKQEVKENTLTNRLARLWKRVEY